MTPEEGLALGRIEAKVDILVAGKAEHAERLSAIEKKFWYATGIGAAFIGVLGTKLGIHV